MALAYPLSAEQIIRAQRIHARLEQWKASDDALRALAERFPNFDAPSTLLKVVVINSLYGTNLYATIRMAEHIRGVMKASNPSDADISLVERIADLPPSRNGERKRHHLSFASKFAHFFIDPDRFPILDSYAEAMLRRHIGTTNFPPAKPSRYAAYTKGLAMLGQLSGWAGSYRELDHYLWLAGTYYVWRKNPRAQINSELQRFFANPGDAQADLNGLLPPGMK